MSKITLNHGSGGREMHELISKLIVRELGNDKLNRMDDAAVLSSTGNKKIALTTDSYVVSPLFFDGGDIGRLAVSGTVNDLSTSGAKPIALTLSFILEEGVQLDTIEKIIKSIAKAANEAEVQIVTGDTKVVEKGKGDLIYINTAGVGVIDDGVNISSHNAKPNDLVFITGPIGNHEVALMKARRLINFDMSVESDAAPLSVQVQRLLSITKNIHVIKDPTRGGVASALTEIADHSAAEIVIEEELIPLDREVRAVCELVGTDPLYMANEGKLIIIAPKESKDAILKTFPSGRIIGQINSAEKKRVILKTVAGTKRRLSMLETIQLPRIC